MGYLGNTPGESFISFAKQVFTIVNSQTAYTLDFAVVDENELRLVVNNVVQEPGSGKAYTASGTTLTLSAALTNGTDEMYCVFLGKARETVTVPTITKDKLNLISTSSSAGLEVKGDGTTDGTLQLNCSQNSHGIKLASPPHSAGQSYTLTFPQSISADTFLKTDGSGNLSFASAGANTPAFEAFLTTNQSVSEDTQTKVQCNSEVFDTAGAYDNSSNYRFTPQVAGKYYVYGAVNMNCNAVSSLKFCYLFTKKNGSDTIHYSQSDHRDNYAGYNLTVEVGGVIDMNGSSDYVELWGLISTNNSTEEFAGASSSRRSYFGAYKIIE
jgi:hypothetical protein